MRPLSQNTFSETKKPEGLSGAPKSQLARKDLSRMEGNSRVQLGTLPYHRMANHELPVSPFATASLLMASTLFTAKLASSTLI